MPVPDGILFISEGQYREDGPYKKIVETAGLEPMKETVALNVLVGNYGRRTYFMFSVVHATEECSKQLGKMRFYNGWGSAFDMMETVINSQR